MTEQRCRNPSEFVRLAQQKNKSVIIEKLSSTDIELAHTTVQSVFNNVKVVPDIQKLHSITMLDINKIECRIYSNSKGKRIVDF